MNGRWAAYHKTLAESSVIGKGGVLLSSVDQIHPTLQTHWMRLRIAIGLAAVAFGCGLDTAREAPAVAAPPSDGACRSTAALIPQLLAFVEDDRLSPLRTVVERRFIPTASRPAPDPSLRTVAAAGLRVVGALGLEQTGYLAEIAASDVVELGLGPLVSRFLAFIDGRVDGRSHYDASDAAAWFVRRCDPEFLLTGLESLVRLESPSANAPWLVAVIEAGFALVDDPALSPLLATFEGLDGTGRPAFVALLRQIMTLVADPEFDTVRINALLESAVYPLVDAELEGKIQRLIVLLDEATAPEAGALIPIQGSLRCGLAHPAQRDVLLGLIYDVLISPPLGITEGLDVIRRPIVADQLVLVADSLRVVREDLDGRDDLRAAAVVLLSTPDVRTLVPMSIDLLDEGVAAELVQALATLLITCAEPEARLQ